MMQIYLIQLYIATNEHLQICLISTKISSYKIRENFHVKVAEILSEFHVEQKAYLF